MSDSLAVLLGQAVVVAAEMAADRHSAPVADVIELRRDTVDTAPVVELGQAVLQLLREHLPSAPEGTRWFYGVEGGRQTIVLRTVES